LLGWVIQAKKYELTRHNVGFEIIDLFCREIRAGKSKRQDFSLVSAGRLGAEEVILVKPQTFMNSSGMAVASLVSEYNIPLEDLCVIYDDLNLDLGFLRIRRKGSAGGHKGVKSIIDSLESQAFLRLRIGIGQTPPQMEAIDYVLSKFSNEEREEIERMEYVAVDALKTIILDGTDSAMNKFNVRQSEEAMDL